MPARTPARLNGPCDLRRAGGVGCGIATVRAARQRARMARDSSPAPRFTASAVAAQGAGAHAVFRSANAFSEISAEDALARAKAEAARRAAAAARGERPPSAGQYPYPDRVVVEPVLERIHVADTGELARVTRNAYGAEVLNAYDVWFADVDTARDTSNAPEETVVTPQAAEQALVDVCVAEPSLGFRMYATRAGLRYLCVTRRFAPRSPESDALLARVLSDPRYRRLCRVQNCFRARLTPKPWRCDDALAPRVPDARPLWRRLLQPAAAPNPFDLTSFAACRFVGAVGAAATADPAIARIVRLHDERSGALGAQPLA